MGHEFTGTVVAAGSAVKSVAVGDKIVAPFTASWYVLNCGYTDVLYYAPLSLFNMGDSYLHSI